MRFSKLILSTALLTCCTLGLATPKLPNPKTTPMHALDSILLRVNGDIVTQSEFDQAFHIARQQQLAAQAQGMPAVSKAKLKKIVLDNLIAQKVQLQMAKQQGITIDDQQLNSAISNIAKDHKVSVSQIYHEVEKTGMTKKAYREQIRNQITILTLQRGVVGAKANVTPAEIKAYQEAHSAYVYLIGDILIPLGSDPSKHALGKASAKAEKIKKTVNQSKNFQKTADKVAPDNNTILDWRPITDLPDVFADTIQSAKLNRAVGPVRAPNGLHVLFLLGKKKNTQALSKQQVQAMLYQQKAETVISPWLKKLKDTSDIKILGKPQ